MDATFKLNGVAELKRKLTIVSEDMRLKGGRYALRKAALIVERKAKAAALSRDDPLTGRQIAMNIATRWNGRLFKQTGNIGYRIGVMGGAESQKSNPDLGPGSKTFHWRFLELGTERMAAKPFMRPALEQSQQEVADEFISQYDKALDRALKKAV